MRLCVRSCRPPAGATRRRAPSRSPAAPIRSCRRRSASARPAPPRSRRSASPSPICGPCGPGAVRRSRSTRVRRPRRSAALRVLGVPEDREAVRQAVAKWDALELEEAIIAAKGAGGMVRTMDEWAKHPQAAAIASLPLMEIVKIGESAPQKLPDGGRPLSGIRVLDLTRVLAGPTCARTLAEHGADVLKITAPHIAARDDQEYDTGHGKLSARLDLRQPKDLETLERLVREGDVFSQGYRPGTLGNRGLSPEQLAALRPGIVYVSLCAFSHVGPWASRRGFDTVG